MATAEIDLLVGLAGLMQNAGGTRRQYRYLESAAYTSASEFGFYMDIAPANDLPSITLTEYPVSGDVVGGDEVLGVQFRIEAKDRQAVKDVISDLRDVIHSRWGGTLGSVTLISAMRSSGTNLGQDSNGRLVRTENYYLTIYRP